MYEAVVIGVSAGGLKALTTILPGLAPTFPLSVVVVQHQREGSDNYLVTHLDGVSALRVKEATEKEALQAGCVYIAPPGYHLLIEEEKTFSLSVDPPVSFARPSIDVLFESAAEVFEERLIGLVLTGANSDGARGLAAIHEAGGLTLVQDPATADSPAMPRAAMAATQIDHVLPLEGIADFLSTREGLAAD